MKHYKVAILGATGAVGREMMKILEEREFPISELHLLASARSAGKILSWKGQDLTIEEASEEAFAGMDIVLGAAENDIAKKFAPAIVRAGRCVCRQFQRLPYGSPGTSGGAGDQSRGRKAAPRHHLQPQLHDDCFPDGYQCPERHQPH